MQSRFKKHIDRVMPELYQHTVMLAISGGLDSTVLARLLVSVGLKPILAHCNFQLRGTHSDNDQDFCKQLAQELGLEFYTKRFDTATYSVEHKLSTQIAARELRYQWFTALSDKHQVTYTLTAHHLDDQLETFLMHLGRGAGLDGLMGIPEKNGSIYRPMLPFTRQEIYELAMQNSWNWREDSSNTSNDYTRNDLRHHVIPELKRILPSLESNFAKSLEYLKQSHYLKEEAVKSFRESAVNKQNNKILISIKSILATEHPEAYLYAILKPYGFSNIDDCYSLLHGQSGKRVASDSHILYKDREQLVLEKPTSVTNKVYVITAEDTQLKLGDQTYDFQRMTKEKAVKEFKNNPDHRSIWMDLKALDFPLKMRTWQKGDRISPLGMSGSKLVSDILIDNKVYLTDKQQKQVLLSGNTILWLIGLKPSRFARITDKTQLVLKITYR